MKARTPTSTREAAFDDSGYGADDDGLVGEGLLEGGPVFRLLDSQARELVVALFVAAFDGDQQLCAGFDGLFCVFKEREGQDSFGLVADIDEDGVD